MSFSFEAYNSGVGIVFRNVFRCFFGKHFIWSSSVEKVYSGMVVGETGRAEDIEINVCKTKHLTNTRTSSSDEALKLVPPKVLSLEQALDFIDTDELLEVTPQSLRIRKKILDPTLRKRAGFKK